MRFAYVRRGRPALPCPGLAGAGGASLNARIPPCLPPRAGGYKRVKKLGWRDEWRGAGRGRAAPRRARWKAEREDRGCGLGFESQPRRHCSRAPSRGEQRSGARLALYVHGAAVGRAELPGCAGSWASRSRLLSSSSAPSHPPSFAVFRGAAASPLAPCRAHPRGAWRAVSPPGGFGRVVEVLGIRMGCAGR